jgi:hypothetical protein
VNFPDDFRVEVGFYSLYIQPLQNTAHGPKINRLSENRKFQFPRLTLSSDRFLRDVCGTFMTVPSNVKIAIKNSLGKWSGRRESNPHHQLGKLNFRSFIFNTYKIVQKKCTCMQRIPCMHCLICVLLGDVLRDGFLSFNFEAIAEFNPTETSASIDLRRKINQVQICLPSSDLLGKECTPGSAIEQSLVSLAFSYIYSHVKNALCSFWAARCATFSAGARKTHSRIL